MIGYKKDLLYTTFLVDEAFDLKNQGFISDADFVGIMHKNPSLKTNRNYLVRAGFFLLGSLLFAANMGLLAWFVFASGGDFDSRLIIYFCLATVLGVIVCEVLAKDHYRYGIDDALLIGALGSFYGFIINIYSYCLQAQTDPYASLEGVQVYIALLMAIAAVFVCLRYCNWIAAVIALVCSTACLYFALAQLKFGMQLMPFLMLFVGLVYFYLFRVLNKNNKVYYYINSLTVIKIFSLLLIYLSCNYLVVRSLSEVVLQSTFTQQHDVPFAPLFWIVTFAVPVLYLILSILTTDKIMLYIGFITMCFSLYTFRSFYHLLPIEVALTFGGILVFTTTFFIIKKIKYRRVGFTFLASKSVKLSMANNVEALVTNSQVTLQTEVFSSAMEFGGGGFSGGGAGDSF